MSLPRWLTYSLEGPRDLLDFFVTDLNFNLDDDGTLASARAPNFPRILEAIDSQGFSLLSSVRSPDTSAHSESHKRT